MLLPQAYALRTIHAQYKYKPCLSQWTTLIAQALSSLDYHNLENTVYVLGESSCTGQVMQHKHVLVYGSRRAKPLQFTVRFKLTKHPGFHDQQLLDELNGGSLVQLTEAPVEITFSESLFDVSADEWLKPQSCTKQLTDW